MPTLLNEKQVKARKSHACRTCTGTAARAGETYLRSTYVHDGQVYDWVQCQLCTSMLSDVFHWVSYDEDGIGFENYAEWTAEHPDDPRAIAWQARFELPAPE